MLIIFVELRPLPAHRRADVHAVLLLIACDILLRELDELIERFVVHLRRNLLDLRIPRAEVVIVPFVLPVALERRPVRA